MSAIRKYASSSAFRLHAAHFPATPWHRPFRAQDLAALDLTSPLAATELMSNRALAVHRLLLNVYEQSMLFLPQRRLRQEDMAAFRAFYEPKLVGLGQTLRNDLEQIAFSYLDEEVQVTGQWSWEQLEKYLVGMIERQERQPCALTASIDATSDPAGALRYLLIQQASDFLSEASAMGRAMLGNYGPVQSELMKVFIDEYGYGVHEKKHSTLFERCCLSVGLHPEPHTYYFHYLPSSLALTNYFHYICANKHLWFRYIGALYYTEASIPHFNKALSRSLVRAFGNGNVDTRYFDEHVHIDRHHRRMVLDHIIKPTFDMHGPQVIPDILLGFESFRLLQDAADRDYLEQVAFIEDLRRQSRAGFRVAPDTHEVLEEPISFTEPHGELSFSHIHDHDELFTVEQGALELFAGLDPVLLEPGCSIVIPAGRLHGSRVTDDVCVYHTRKIRRKP